VVKSSEPMFNVPAVVLALLGLFVAIHVVRTYALTPDQDLQLLELFAFIPARYDANLLLGGVGAEIWTFVTYALIHASATHLAMNTVWFVPFGSAVARRFGAVRFLLFFSVTAAAGALAHLIAHPGEVFPVIGASASISGMMAGATRFAFQPKGPLATWQAHNERSYHIPAVPLSEALRDARVVIFLVVWFGLNFLFGFVGFPMTGTGQVVAWEAHIGGFVAGLFLFSLFDPVPTEYPPEDGTTREEESVGG